MNEIIIIDQHDVPARFSAIKTRQQTPPFVEANGFLISLQIILQIIMGIWREIDEHRFESCRQIGQIGSGIGNNDAAPI